MGRLLLIPALLFSVNVFSQVGFCIDASPVPARMLNDEEKKSLQKFADSLNRKNGIKSILFIGGDTTLNTRNEFNNLLVTLTSATKDLTVDSFSKYKILFRENITWNI